MKRSGNQPETQATGPAARQEGPRDRGKSLLGVTKMADDGRSESDQKDPTFDGPGIKEALANIADQQKQDVIFSHLASQDRRITELEKKIARMPIAEQVQEQQNTKEGAEQPRTVRWRQPSQY